MLNRSRSRLQPLNGMYIANQESMKIQQVVIEIVAGFLPINVIAADSCPNAGDDSKVPG